MGGRVSPREFAFPGSSSPPPTPRDQQGGISCPFEVQGINKVGFRARLRSPPICMHVCFACGHLLRGVGIPAFTLPGCSHTDGRHSQWDTIELIPLYRSGHVVPAYPPADCAGGVLVPVRDNGVMCMSGMRRNIPLNRVDMLFLTPGRQQDVLDLSCCSARSFWRSAV